MGDAHTVAGRCRPHLGLDHPKGEEGVSLDCPNRSGIENLGSASIGILILLLFVTNRLASRVRSKHVAPATFTGSSDADG